MSEVILQWKAWRCPGQSNLVSLSFLVWHHLWCPMKIRMFPFFAAGLEFQDICSTAAVWVQGVG